MKTFYHFLANVAVVSVINFTIWFAITFYIWLQTESVFATGMISGIYLITTALTSIWFGSLVDHHKKQAIMQFSALASLGFYIICLIIYQSVDQNTFKDPASPILWIFTTLLMLGVIAGNPRSIALSTLVTLLIPEDKRDKANGLVGTVTGTTFLITSAISGLLVGAGGMLYVLLLAIGAIIVSLIHLQFIKITEEKNESQEDVSWLKKIDLSGTFQIVKFIPGLLALILFSTFNNFLGGVFMALMDAYGLSLVSVQAWGLLWAVLSTGMIIGSAIIAKTGLGRNPVRTLLLINVVLWTVTIFFPLNASIILLSVGMYIYMLLMPYAEASEQTVLQKVVPYERQGRVFGFAQSVEQSASPITAFLIGPLTQLFFIPFMTTGQGVELIGDWFGTGQDRGIALVFVLAGVIGLAVSLFALKSKYYHQLSARYLES